VLITIAIGFLRDLLQNTGRNFSGNRAPHHAGGRLTAQTKDVASVANVPIACANK
jgi:hypothetical protein